MRLSAGRVAAITGAGSGIGRALAVELAGRGLRLALSDVNCGDVEQTTREVKALGAEAEWTKVDVTDRGSVYGWAELTADRFGGVDLIVNNAGVAMTGDIVDTSIDDIKWIVDVDFWGVVHGTKAFLPYVTNSDDGHIVNVSSVFGLMAVPSQAAYNAAKFAVRGFTEALRQEMLLSPSKVAVSCVHPGGIRTNVVRSQRVVGFDNDRVSKMFDRRLAKTSPEKAAQIIARGVERDRARILVGPDAHGIEFMTRAFGSGYQRLVAGIAHKSLRGSRVPR